jgi:hypothetical protein
MAVDLADLIPNLKVQISPPGTDLFSGVTNNEWLTRLENGFWEARLDGLFMNYRAADGAVEPISGDTDLQRHEQQLIILYAALDVVMTELRNAQSMFSAKAGPVEYETQKSAQLLRDVLKATQDQILRIIGNMTLYGVNSTVVYDAIISRTQEMAWGDVWWVR